MALQTFDKNLFLQPFPALAWSADCLLFLHGFPGDRTKNEDLAGHIAEITKRDAYVLHFSGLGKSGGQFSFTQTITDAKNTALHLCEEHRYKKVHLVAHSWGGLVAINLLKEIPEIIGNVILLAPFSSLPDRETTKVLVEQFAQEFKQKGQDSNFDTLMSDADQIAVHHDPRKIIADLDPKGRSVLVLQGKQDTVTPVAATRQLVALFKKAPTYIEVDDDHWFSNRESLKDLCIKWFQEVTT